MDEVIIEVDHISRGGPGCLQTPLHVVAGTQEGTKKIKTGMRIRVDSDMCAVYILEK